MESHRSGQNGHLKTYGNWQEQPLPMPPGLDSAQIKLMMKQTEEKAAKFRDIVKPKDRRYHFRLYKQCFVGCEVVDQMLEHGLAETREEAVQLGRRFLMDRMLKHVCSDHNFKDRYLFYHFAEDESNSQISGDKRSPWYAGGRTETIFEEEYQDDTFKAFDASRTRKGK